MIDQTSSYVCILPCQVCAYCHANTLLQWFQADSPYLSVSLWKPQQHGVTSQSYLACHVGHDVFVVLHSNGFICTPNRWNDGLRHHSSNVDRVSCCRGCDGLVQSSLLPQAELVPNQVHPFLLVLPKQLPLSIQSGNLSVVSHRVAAAVHALFSVHNALEASRWIPHYTLGDCHPLACVTPLASLQGPLEPASKFGSPSQHWTS